MLGKNYKIFSLIQKISLGIGILVSLFIFIFLIFQKDKTDGDIIFIVDVSHSMNSKVGNGEITRLDLSKKVIEKIVQKDKNKHKFGIIIFNQGAEYLVAPTFDTGSLLNFSNSLQTNILPGGGSNISQAMKIFENNSENDLAVLISDGDDIETNFFSSFDKNIVAIGVGDDGNKKVFYTDGTEMVGENGKIVFSKINKNNIKKTSNPHFFVEKIEDIENINLGENIFSKNSFLSKIYIVISFLVLVGLSL